MMTRLPDSVLAPGQFDRIAKALADPRRVAMLQLIASAGEQCANQILCRDFPVSKATVSHHLKELVRCGLVDSTREGQYVAFRARRETLQAYTEELLRRMQASSAVAAGIPD